MLFRIIIVVLLIIIIQQHDLNLWNSIEKSVDTIKSLGSELQKLF